ncbi:MAG: hypothetical protein JNL11_07860 [Bdellovibrionaceae bacterium]|nr:hypothetical protein [Pseudobdellovibrionaceae bacterium]
MVHQIKDIEERLPSAMIGVATDNGSEFINDEVLGHLEKRELPVNMIRLVSFIHELIRF